MSTALDELKKKNKTTLLDSCILLAAKHGYPMTADEAAADLAKLRSDFADVSSELTRQENENIRIRAARDEAQVMFEEYINWGKFGNNHQPAAWLEKYGKGV